MIFAIFDLQVIVLLLTKFRVNWAFGSGEEAQNRYQNSGHGGHLGFPIGTIYVLSDLQVTPMLTSKLTGLSIQEKKRKKDFQDGGH